MTDSVNSSQVYCTKKYFKKFKFAEFASIKCCHSPFHVNRQYQQLRGCCYNRLCCSKSALHYCINKRYLLQIVDFLCILCVHIVYLGLAIQGTGACIDLTDGVSIGRPHGPKNLLEPCHQLGFLCKTHLLQLLWQHLVWCGTDS